MTIIILYVIFLIWTFKNLFTERTNNGINKCIDTIMNRFNKLPIFICVLLAFLKYFFLSMITPAIILGLVYYCIIRLK